MILRRIFWSLGLQCYSVKPSGVEKWKLFEKKLHVSKAANRISDVPRKIEDNFSGLVENHPASTRYSDF